MAFERPEVAANVFTSYFAWTVDVSFFELANIWVGLDGSETCASGVAARILDGVNSAEVAIIFEDNLGVCSSRF